jgi:hypothetical protein
MGGKQRMLFYLLTAVATKVSVAYFCPSCLPLTPVLLQYQLFFVFHGVTSINAPVMSPNLSPNHIYQDLAANLGSLTSYFTGGSHSILYTHRNQVCPSHPSRADDSHTNFHGGL